MIRYDDNNYTMCLLTSRQSVLSLGFEMPSHIDEAGHTKAFDYPVAEHWGESRNVSQSYIMHYPVRFYVAYTCTYLFTYTCIYTNIYLLFAIGYQIFNIITI